MVLRFQILSHIKYETTDLCKTGEKISQREHELILDSRKILNSKTILIRSLTEENSKILLTSAWSRRSRKEFLLTSAQIPRARIIQDKI